MHSPKLIEEILELRLELTLCDPHDTADILAKIDEKMDSVCKISKVPLERVKTLCLSRFPQYVADQRKNGSLIRAKEIK